MKQKIEKTKKKYEIGNALLHHIKTFLLYFPNILNEIDYQ
jgi:hypothetical protein